MLFEITHDTVYRYHGQASEAYIEARLTPPGLPTQRILEHRILFNPEGPVSSYTDFYGNVVSFYSMTLRHEKLSIRNLLRVRTAPCEGWNDAMRVPIAECRQIFTSALADIFDYVQSTSVVLTGGEAAKWVRQYLQPERPLGEALDALTTAIYEWLEYKPGSTDISTPLSQIWESRKGVCQDYAHIMLSILRTAGLPCRYVCGYIESEPPPPPDAPESSRRLVGSAATHAWVEALIPGMHWVGFDPTNNRRAGEQHVAVSYGRDFRDAAPVKGTFKGTGTKSLSVNVKMRRIQDKKAGEAAA